MSLTPSVSNLLDTCHEVLLTQHRFAAASSTDDGIPRNCIEDRWARVRIDAAVHRKPEGAGATIQANVDGLILTVRKRARACRL